MFITSVENLHNFRNYQQRPNFPTAALRSPRSCTKLSTAFCRT